MNEQQQSFQNPMGQMPNGNNMQKPTNNQNIWKYIAIALAVIIVAFLAYTVISKPSDQSNPLNPSDVSNSLTSTKTINAKEYSAPSDYQDYVGQKITITNVTVSSNALVAAPNKLVSANFLCSNQSSLNLKEGSVITVTGTVTSTVGFIINLNNCSIK